VSAILRHWQPAQGYRDAKSVVRVKMKMMNPKGITMLVLAGALAVLPGCDRKIPTDGAQATSSRPKEESAPGTKQRLTRRRTRLRFKAAGL
jgi:hypothetical protein